MPRRELTDQRAIVSGASSGIGQAIVRELAKSPVRLVLVARREARLRELAAELREKDRDVEIVAGDIADPAVRRAAVERAEQVFGGLDMLVNNAGVGAIGPFAQADDARLRKIMEVNFFAPVELIRLAIPSLKRGRSPLIVNVGSILGHRGIPLHTEYCASKFALQGFSESLRAELAGEGIGLLIVSPGTTQTEFSSHLLERTASVPWSVNRGVSAEYVAKATVRAIQRGTNEIIPNWRGRMMLWLNRLCPRILDRRLAKYATNRSTDDTE